jgi:hypothetical protein
MTTNANIKQLSVLIDPTDELNDKLNEFDSIIAETFGDEIDHITHELWSEHISFTSVGFKDGEYIGFRVSAKMVRDDTYRASKDRLRKAFKTFDIEMPYWMYR